MVCEILLLLLVCGIDKGKVFDISTQMGFGQRNNLCKEKLFMNFGPLLVNSMNLAFPFGQKKAEQPPSKKKK
jgi:hypothetical protein